MLIGYARVSTNDQETATQVAALKAAGCERTYREKASGGRWDRPELHRLLDQIRKEDVLVVWKLDRLSRSLRDVLAIMDRLSEAGAAGFASRKNHRRRAELPGRSTKPFHCVAAGRQDNRPRLAGRPGARSAAVTASGR